MNANDYLMTRLREIYDYKSKFPKSNKRLNQGAERLLAREPNWVAAVPVWSAIALDTVLTSGKRAQERGKDLHLTAVSGYISRGIAYDLGYRDYADAQTNLCIGDLLIEALVMEGRIELDRDARVPRAPWNILLTDVLAERPILRATYTEQPADITSLLDPRGYPYIKGWTGKKMEKKFLTLLDAPCIKALNHLRKQAWALNTEVYTIVADSYKDICNQTIDLLKANGHKVTVPLMTTPKYRKGSMRWADGTEYLGTKDKRLQEMRSKVADTVSVIGKAGLLKDEPKFYQDYSLDYRGRMYCNESFFQYQGSDIARSLFLFAEGKKVDAKGLYRMKIHAANSYNCTFHIDKLPAYFTTDYAELLRKENRDEISLDKLTLDDRAKWVDENLEFVRTNRKLLDSADSPVAFLAVCIELDKVLSNENYLSRLPIPLDGANNGWQHLAAMSNDEQAGALVSLTDSNVQKDFYVAVAQEMINLRPEWYAERDIPMNLIRKGISKRGSMVRGYSAGRGKINDNMIADCRKYGMTEKYNITEADTFTLAGDLIDAVNIICPGPLQIKNLLQDVASYALSLPDCKGLDWVTPSGFPVHYSYFLTEENRVKNTIKPYGRINHVLQTPVLATDEEVVDDETGEITKAATTVKVLDRKAYSKGVAPNFVHSRDAAHLALTIVKFGGAFGAVHDSFATHACDAEALLEATKDTFIGMYKNYGPNDIVTDILGPDLGKRVLNGDVKFTKTSKTGKVKEVTVKFESVKVGTLDIDSIKNSKFFFC